MSNSIIQTDKTHCFICEKNARAGIEIHHIIYGNGRRQLSEKYGLTVPLCHHCHNEPPDGVHFNAEIDLKLKQIAQEKAMKHYGWTAEQFAAVFDKNYL